VKQTKTFSLWICQKQLDSTVILALQQLPTTKDTLPLIMISFHSSNTYTLCRELHKGLD